MDKYTVDLDKVLNDFEYSELTEQAETVRPSAAAKQDVGPVRHSMNNVFSSLNDYLNTEITDRRNKPDGERAGAVKTGGVFENGTDGLNALTIERHETDNAGASLCGTDTFTVVESETFPVKETETFLVKETETFPVKETETFPVRTTESFEFTKDNKNAGSDELLRNGTAGGNSNDIGTAKPDEAKPEVIIANNASDANRESIANNDVKRVADDDDRDYQESVDVEQILDELERKIERDDKKILRDFESDHAVKITAPPPVVIGFDGDIDEAELHRYLDDLEDELGIPNNTSARTANGPDGLIGVIKNDIKKNTNELNSASKVNNDDRVIKNGVDLPNAKTTTNNEYHEVKTDNTTTNNSITLGECESPETVRTADPNADLSGRSEGKNSDIPELSDEISKLQITNRKLSEMCKITSNAAPSETNRKSNIETGGVPKIDRKLKPKHSDIPKLDADIPKLTIHLEPPNKVCDNAIEVKTSEETAVSGGSNESGGDNDLGQPNEKHENDNVCLKESDGNFTESEIADDPSRYEQEDVDVKLAITEVACEIVAPEQPDNIAEHPTELSEREETIDDGTDVKRVVADDETDSDTVEGKTEANSGEEGGSGTSEQDTYETCSENVGAETRRNSPADSITSPSERPSSLDINGQSDAKREINLVGNPGSTPYNNLYVTKEISDGEKAKMQPGGNYESESSASVSPTFSEASTDSVRSTDSTDSEPEHAKEGNNEDGAAAVVNEETREGAAVESSEDGGDVHVDAENAAAAAHVELSEDETWLGKRAPLWIQDGEALNCLHCDMKFTIIKRRHHCRACGFVLCSKCCNLKHRLEYLDTEARVCTKCHAILTRDGNSSSGSEISPGVGNSPARTNNASSAGRPNPNNPMEYCSVVPPLQQVMNAGGDAPPTVMVPVGVLKRKGSNKAKHNKSVMFCDGIRPGSDLTNLDNDFNYNETKSSSSSSSSPASSTSASSKKSSAPAAPPPPKVNRNMPVLDSTTKSFIPENDSCLPPTVTQCKTDVTYTECANNANVVEMLKNEMLTFAMQANLHVHVRLLTMDCCINKQAWCFSTEGMINVGQDEIVVLLEYIDNERVVPKDVLHHLNHIYNEAVKGNTVTELGLSLHPTTNFLDSKNHAGFIYIRPTFQCLQKLIVPKEPYLFGVLVHRWETPWAKIFPLRLVLRLGAEYRYYPSPIISSRHRDSVFVEIGHTIINLLADFRNFTYTLPNIRGLTIHMEGKNTTVTIPVNRYEQVMKSLSNSSDHILAFGGNFSENTDSHLVCIQDTHGNNENNYTTHAINIQNKPRQVTGASFIVFNGALKSSSGLTAKSSIVEDGLMIQIPPDQMVQVRESLRNMKDHTIQCGCVNAASDETVNVVWGEPDTNFNNGVKSCIDEQSLSGVPSIRVHNGKDYVCSSGKRFIRWTEVFLMQNGEENARTQDPVDVSKVAESISKATCQALVNYLDLLAKNNAYKIGIRTTLHVDSVSYSAGSNGTKLAPLYMNSLDNELIPVLHRITSSSSAGGSAIVLELIFRILNA